MLGSKIDKNNPFFNNFNSTGSAKSVMDTAGAVGGVIKKIINLF